MTVQMLTCVGRSSDDILRRGIDVVLASIGLVVTAPLILLIAIAIRVDSPGPIFFHQTRLGLRTQRFRLYKFRKFVDGPKARGPAVTVKNDPRMTRIGRLLERSKLDELPQLWNILIGDMALVGPRPETLDFADCFVDGFRAVLNYRPGLFGPSQAAFRNECALYPAGKDPHEFYRDVLFPAKATIDLRYFGQRTLFSDFLWILRGVLAVIGLSTVAAATPTTNGGTDTRLEPASADAD